MTNDTGSDIKSHAVVPREDWLAARTALLAKEKAFTRLRDELSRQRRELPWVRVEKAYVFDAPHGKETLADLFEGRSQLVVYHFMFSPEWEGSVQALFVLGRQFQSQRRSSESSRRELRRHFPGAAGEDQAIQEANGVELQVDIFRGGRF